MQAGARQVEVTVNGIGERAGNTSLEEVVATIHEKKLGDTSINRQYIGETSKLLSKITGVDVQPNKAIVGKNAFAHEAGIHQDGMIKDASTYEIMDPKDYGMESVITFGPRSGRNALKAKYMSLGYQLSEDDFEKAARAFTKIADITKEIDDADVIHSIKGGEIPRHFKFKSYHQTNSQETFANVLNLYVGEDLVTKTGEGVGAIHSGIEAIKSILGQDYSLKEYKTYAVEHGSKAKGSTRIVLEHDGFSVIGTAKSKDVVTSVFQAYLDGVNRLEYCIKNKN